ncbi:hypothetical protein Q7P37_000634 [Cladosporium fusiforme]
MPALSPRSLHGTPRPPFPFTSSAPSPLTTPSPPPPPPPSLLHRSASAPALDMAIRPATPVNPANPEDAIRAKPTNGCVQAEEMMSPSGGMVQPPVVKDPRPSPVPVPDLVHVSHLLRQAKYQKQRRLQTQRLFHRLQTATSRTQRLAIASRHVRRTLADCLRSEDKHSFAHLFNTFHSACEQSAVLSSTGPSESQLVPDDADTYPDGFLDDLSTSSRGTIVQLLTRLRYDQSFVADRIASLSQKELIALLSDGSFSRRPESVLGGSQRSSTRSVKPLGFVVDRVVDDISAGSFKSSLETLVHLHNPAGQGSAAHARSTDLWANVAAHLIAGKKQGGDRLTAALLDIWSFQTEWPGKDRLRTWMLHTLRRGQFLTEQPSRQSFRMRVHGQMDLSTEEAARTETFCRESVSQLLELLADPDGASVVPSGALELSAAIHEKLSDAPDHQRDLPSFLVTRWLFGSFLMDLLVLPESHGLLAGHFISDLARQKILREVAARAQKVVFDVVYAWYKFAWTDVLSGTNIAYRKNGNVLSTDTVDRVQKVMARFDCGSNPRARVPVAEQSLHTIPSMEHFLALSAPDVLTVMNSLFPARRPVSVSSDHDTLRSGLQSSASSVSGFSLFRTNEASAPTWNPTASFSSAATSPGQLFAPFDPRPAGLPQVDDDPGYDPEVMDARSELEEYTAAHRTNDGTNWALLVADDRVEQVYSYNEALQRERGFHDLTSKYPDKKGRGRISSADKAAIETVLSDMREVSAWELHAGSDFFDGPVTWTERVLELFDLRIAECEARSDFVAAHAWMCHTDAIEQCVQTHGSESLVYILWEIEDSAQSSLDDSLAIMGLCDAWLNLTQPALQVATMQVDHALQTNRALRTKMWYSADIRTSSAYDNVRAVTSALRVMGKPKRPNGPKQAPPLRHWSGTRLSSQNIHLKSEAQILDLLGSKTEHGGPNKLSDEQSKLTVAWMRRNDIQLICAGEERLHKLCMELRKCVEQLVTSSGQDNPLLWSNALFAHDPKDAPRHNTNGMRFQAPDSAPRRFDLSSLQVNPFNSIDNASSISRTLSNASSRDLFDRSPTLATASSITFWSPAATEIRSPSSTTSIASQAGRGLEASPRKPNRSNASPNSSATDALREQVTGLLLSDVGASLFVDGSETDVAFLSGLGGDLTRQHLESKVVFASREQSKETLRHDGFQRTPRLRPRYDFELSFTTMFELFSIECDPYKKLQHLNDIQKLLRPYLAQRKHMTASSSPPENNTLPRGPRAATGKQYEAVSEPLTDGFFTLFCQRNIRPHTLFRDLQYIASLVPSTVLDSSSRGQAFWNAAAAALRLKSEARQKLVETADSIIDYQTNNRGHAASSAQQQRDSATFTAPSRTPSAELIAHYSMADAAHLLQITAREGDAAAQRELATLYLTHPELMDNIIAPFALPSEVFRDEIEGRWKRDRDPERCDPKTMCVAHHWMVLGARGGDALAREFLRQREEMERLP